MTNVRSAPGPRPAHPARRVWFAALAACALTLLSAPPAHAIRVATWNLLQYPNASINLRQPNFRTVMAAMNPDLIVCQELYDNGNFGAGRDSFLTNVLNVIQPGQWSGTYIDVGSGEGMGLFWKSAVVTPFNIQAVADGGPRSVLLAGIRVVGYPNGTFFRLYGMHLKAGNTAADSTTRRNECTGLRTSLNLLPANTNFLLMGDSNFYGAFEAGYQRLTESQADNDGRLVDPLPMPGNWHLNSLYKSYDTQCPCFGSCIDPAFSGGGMDDRFDLALPSVAMTDGNGFDMLPGSTVAFGNDGAHFNTDINGDGFNNQVGYAVATALRNSADHIPVFVEIQVPAKVAAGSGVDFGRLIVGSVVTANLSVADAAPVPGDELNYTLAAPAGFTAPAGSFTANAGAAGNVHVLGMDASSAGLKSGTLTVASNAADTASKAVLLTGTVLRHAAASLDSLLSVTTRSVDFGNNAILHFDDVPVRVHDFGYDALQAKLAIGGASISGGNGRFSIVGGFSPTQVGGTAQTYSLHFDSYGATLDSTYTATLTITSADEPLPGASAAAPLTVELSATPASGVLAVGGGAHALRFEPARPNPLTHGTTFAFELPRAQRASLEIYDLGGRHVATLASGELGAGRHQVGWNALDLTGQRVAGGLYFARFATPGLNRVERVIVLP
jgi:endonuclease/exonuclease/phosphatase family metal-dependent hydrolase